MCSPVERPRVPGPDRARREHTSSRPRAQLAPRIQAPVVLLFRHVRVPPSHSISNNSLESLRYAKSAPGNTSIMGLVTASFTTDARAPRALTRMEYYRVLPTEQPYLCGSLVWPEPLALDLRQEPPHRIPREASTRGVTREQLRQCLIHAPPQHLRWDNVSTHSLEQPHSLHTELTSSW
jgi:hypothetical protein